MSIEIIIPNYNGFELIEKNVPKVIAAIDEKDISITIVDDASRQDEQEKLSAFIEKLAKDSKIPIRLLLNKNNVGFSSNVNRGALKSSADIIVLLNSDVSPEKGFLTPLLSHFKDENIFGVGCMDKSIEGDKQVLRGRGLAKWVRGFLVHRRGEVDKTDTFWISGGSCAYRTSIFQQLGGLDSLYNPFYWEDIDISYRAQKYGYKVVFEPKSIVVHTHAKGSIKKHYKNDRVQAIAMRNQITFVWKNITDNSLLLSNILFLPYYIIRSIVTRDMVFLKGFVLAVFRLPAIMKRRSEQKKYYIRSDKEIIPA